MNVHFLIGARTKNGAIFGVEIELGNECVARIDSECLLTNYRCTFWIVL
jgi:hypothetical protein